MDQDFYERKSKSGTELRKSEMKGGQTFFGHIWKACWVNHPDFCTQIRLVASRSGGIFCHLRIASS